MMQQNMTTSAMNALLKSDSRMLLTEKKELPIVRILLISVESRTTNVLLKLLSVSHAFQTALTTITCVNQTSALMTLTFVGNANQIAIVKIKILSSVRPAQIHAYKKTEV
jgi:hypothetical protein